MTVLPQPLAGLNISAEDIVDSLAGVAEQIGVPTALALARHFGGTRLYVPSRWRDDTQLLLVGDVEARALCRMFGPGRIDVPKCPWRPSAIRRIALALRAREHTVNDIAILLDVSWRTVNAAIRGEAALTRPRTRRNDDRQIDIEGWLAGKSAAE